MRAAKRSLLTLAAILLLIPVSCSSENDAPSGLSSLRRTGSMELKYAEQFTVDNYDGGYSIVTISDDRFLIVPENKPVPETDQDITVIHQPADNIYLAASSAMDLFDGFGGLSNISMTSTAAHDWSLPNIRSAVDSGEIAYIGKYSSPDYETLVSEGCPLAIESTMIYHTPEVREKLEALGIPVLVERSSYESHPLGRLEWIKLYGLLTGNSEAAQSFFDEKIRAFEELDAPVEGTQKKKAAFFYISSNGYVNVRKPGDYVSKMIELAGGEYIFTAADLSVDDNALSTMNIQTETFYTLARDADILIYNSTIEGELDSVSQLIDKCGILSDFKAVREGNVWCAGQNMFQQTTGAADMICDLRLIFTEQTDERALTFLYRLE